jgi:predicted patatin/cPLA2 family phospholipase
MAHRHERYNAQMDKIDEREAAGTLLVIRPKESLGISRTENNPAELERVYQLGREEGLKRLEAVRGYLAKF